MKSRAFPYAFVALVVGGGGVAWMECGSSTCGNMKVESGEQCDKGAMNGVDGSGCSSTCQNANIAVATIEVSYTKLLNEVPGFNGATCIDLGIGAAHVVLSGPQPVDEVWTGSGGCQQSKQYPNVTPGTYQATITLLDANMQPLTNAVSTAMTDVQKGPLTNLSINFLQKDFVKQDYVGQLDWDAQWGMADKRCNDIGPSIMESVTLEKDKGMVVTTPAATDDGLKLSGMFGACLTASSTSPQRVKPLPWGHYTLVLQAKVTGAVAFCQSFQVFVPPGTSPQTYELVVNPFDPNADGGACP
jgi:cysteine-rich repeat protein